MDAIEQAIEDLRAEKHNHTIKTILTIIECQYRCIKELQHKVDTLEKQQRQSMIGRTPLK